MNIRGAKYVVTGQTVPNEWALPRIDLRRPGVTTRGCTPGLSAAVVFGYFRRTVSTVPVTFDESCGLSPPKLVTSTPSSVTWFTSVIGYAVGFLKVNRATMLRVDPSAMRSLAFSVRFCEGASPPGTAVLYCPKNRPRTSVIALSDMCTQILPAQTRRALNKKNISTGAYLYSLWLCEEIRIPHLVNPELAPSLFLKNPIVGSGTLLIVSSDFTFR